MGLVPMKAGWLTYFCGTGVSAANADFMATHSLHQLPKSIEILLLTSVGGES